MRSSPAPRPPVGGALGLVAGALLPLFATVSAQQSDWQLERKELSYPAGELHSLRLVNDFGDIRLRAGEGPDILISALVQRHADDPRDLNPKIANSNGTLSVEVRFDDSLEAPIDPSWPSRRIDVGVFVPATVAATLTTGSGLIELRDLVATAELETASGAIDVETLGGLTARTQSGNIRAQLQRSNWPQPASLESATGNLRVELLRGAKASVVLETRGAITTDYSLVIERAEDSLFKRGQSEIGGGGQHLSLVSNRGAIRLMAVIVPEEDVAHEQ